MSLLINSSYAFHENLEIDDNKASQLYQATPNDPAIVQWKSALQSAITGMDKCFTIQEAISCQSLIPIIVSNCKSHPNTLLACNDARLPQYPLILKNAQEAQIKAQKEAEEQQKKAEEIRKKNKEELKQSRVKFEECMEKGGSIETCKVKLNLTVSRYSNLTGNSSSSNSTYP